MGGTFSGRCKVEKLGLPHGYQTQVSEQGHNFSHPPRQLLAIAHAILADRRILILDGATSSVDTRTEMLIQQALLNLMAGVGALASKLKEASQASFLILSPLMAGYLVGILAPLAEGSQGALPVALSLFPLTTPVVMIMRVTDGSVPLWQLLLSAGLMVCTTYAIWGPTRIPMKSGRILKLARTMARKARLLPGGERGEPDGAPGQCKSYRPRFSIGHGGTHFYPGKILDLLQYKLYKWPGHGLALLSGLPFSRWVGPN